MKIALTYDWRYGLDENPPDLSALRGQVVAAEYRPNSDVLILNYADGRSATVALVQCKTHQCDETCMVVEVLE